MAPSLTRRHKVPNWLPLVSQAGVAASSGHSPSGGTVLAQVGKGSTFVNHKVNMLLTLVTYTDRLYIISFIYFYIAIVIIPYYYLIRKLYKKQDFWHLKYTLSLEEQGEVSLPQMC